MPSSTADVDTTAIKGATVKRTIRTTVVALGLALVAGQASLPPAQSAPATRVPAGSSDPVKLVNTFIGSQDDGNTFPGASMPAGMTQVSPIGSHYAGWRYGDPKIKGFGHSFLSGAGCWEQGGQVSVLPTSGTVAPGGDFDTTQASTFDHSNYAATYTHDGEVGDAGYYRTRLTSYGGIGVEATADVRTGVERYTFGPGSRGNVFVNTGQATDRHGVAASHVEVVDSRTLVGEVRTQSFCGGRQYSTWFSIRFDRPFRTHGVWTPEGGRPGADDSGRGQGLRGAWVSFDTADEKSVEMTTAISHVDPEGAWKNLEAEGLDDAGDPVGFNTVRAKAQNAWRTELRRISVTGGSHDDQVVFATALYHVLLQPLTGNDVDGRYRGFDDQIHVAEDWTYYEFYSLWDTYRTQNQLLAMLRPSVARDIGRSVLAIHEQGGWLPRWAYANFETNVMTGDPVTPFLVDLWRFGALDGREEQAYRALLQNADGVPPASSPFQGRAGNPRYLEDGFVQYDPGFPKKGMDVDPHHGGSATLEYALADCSLSVMADALGHDGDAQRLAERGGNWASVWDPATRDRGFVGYPRPRTDDGAWHATMDGYLPDSNAGFHEGTAWQYQWLAQQDVPGLVTAMGGRAEAGRRLDVFFDLPEVLRDPAYAARNSWVVGAYSYYEQNRYNPNNEPDLHSPSMYSFIGQPWKTSAVMRAAQTLFTNAPNGVTGNDDLGTMSAWYVFSALGLYPAVPGTGELTVHAPRFSSATIRLENGRSVVIDAPGADANRLQYVDSATVNGRAHPEPFVSWDQLRNGGRVRLGLTSDRGATSWGESATPTSPCAGSADLVPFAGQETNTVLVPGEQTPVEIGVQNLSDSSRTVDFTVADVPGLTVEPASGSVEADAKERAAVPAEVRADGDAEPGLHAVPVTFTDAETGETLGTRTLSVGVARAPHSPTTMWYSGMENRMDATLTRHVSVPAGSTSFSAWLLYDTEVDFDYLYGEVSTDGGTSWQQIGDRLHGHSGGWRNVAYDLSPYAGQDVRFRLRYTTGGGVLERGVYADDFALTSNGEVIWSDDVESGDAGWEVQKFTPTDRALID